LKTKALKHRIKLILRRGCLHGPVLYQRGIGVWRFSFVFLATCAR